jgi:site-specific recombinase XerD
MSALRDALVQYVAVRRALGTKFREPAVTLDHFVDFLEREAAQFITTELALRWATEPKLVQRATWARRLGLARGFAQWLSAVDARTEVPPRRILEARRRRKAPHIYTDQQIERLIAEASRVPSPTAIAGTDLFDAHRASRRYRSSPRGGSSTRPL